MSKTWWIEYVELRKEVLCSLLCGKKENALESTILLWVCSFPTYTGGFRTSMAMAGFGRYNKEIQVCSSLAGENFKQHFQNTKKLMKACRSIENNYFRKATEFWIAYKVSYLNPWITLKINNLHVEIQPTVQGQSQVRAPTQLFPEPHQRGSDFVYWFPAIRYLQGSLNVRSFLSDAFGYWGDG